MSATLPARLGEPSRALIVSRRLGRARERLPVVLGTLVSQTLLNVLALVILGAVMFTTIGLFAGRQQALIWYALAPFAVLVAVLVAPALLRSGLPSRSARVARWLAQARGATARVRTGLIVFRRPRLGADRHGRAARRLGAAVGRLLRAARRAAPRRRRRPRRGRRRAVRGQRHRGAAGDAVQPRRLPGRLRGGAHRRLRRSTRRRRSATGSSCRRSRSPPRRHGRARAASRRACPGARCACARCTPRPVSLGAARRSEAKA